MTPSRVYHKMNTEEDEQLDQSSLQNNQIHIINESVDFTFDDEGPKNKKLRPLYQTSRRNVYTNDTDSKQ